MAKGERHGFEDLEAMLATPSVDGCCLVAVATGGSFERAGLRVADIVTHIDGVAVDHVHACARALSPAGEDDTRPRRLAVLRGDRALELVVAPGLAGAMTCLVSRERPAWEETEDSTDAPVVGHLRREGTWWFHNRLGDEPAGFERVHWRPVGDMLEVETRFRIGGASGDGATWDYSTRTSGLHRLDACLSLLRTAFWEGAPEEEQQIGEAARGDDGLWRGTHRGREVSFPAPSEGTNTGYHAWLITTTMPLREGAVRTWLSAADGSGRPTSRARFRCLGPGTVEGMDGPVGVWTFLWRSYGAHPDDHDVRIHVDEERRPVRIDWGPDYGHCVSLRTDEARAFEGVPAHVRPA